MALASLLAFSSNDKGLAGVRLAGGKVDSGSEDVCGEGELASLLGEPGALDALPARVRRINQTDVHSKHQYPGFPTIVGAVDSFQSLLRRMIQTE